MNNINPEQYLLEPNGDIPNSRLPLLVYKNVAPEAKHSSSYFEKIFHKNQWRNTWQGGVYFFHHYHSNTHEVLGVYSGTATIQFGGSNGIKVNVQAGDVVVIPAGIAHKCIASSDHFAVVGGYPDGSSPDMVTAGRNNREDVPSSIDQVEVPVADPLLGREEGLVKIWTQAL